MKVIVYCLFRYGWKLPFACKLYPRFSQAAVTTGLHNGQFWFSIHVSIFSWFHIFHPIRGREPCEFPTRFLFDVLRAIVSCQLVRFWRRISGIPTDPQPAYFTVLTVHTVNSVLSTMRKS